MSGLWWCDTTSVARKFPRSDEIPIGETSSEQRSQPTSAEDGQMNSLSRERISFIVPAVSR